MERRGFLATLLGLPFMKWAKPKVRPPKVTCYFPVEHTVRFDQIPIAKDGEPVFCTWDSNLYFSNNKTSSIEVIDLQSLPSNCRAEIV